MKRLQLFAMVICVGFLAQSALAEDVYTSRALNELTFTDQPLPEVTQRDEAVNALNRNRQQVKEAFLRPYALVDGGAEVYLVAPDRTPHPWLIRRSMADNIASTRLVVRSTTADATRGTLYLPKADWSGMQGYAFRISQPSKDQQLARADFLEAKEHHYRSLQAMEIPGAAWFRYQAQQARGARDVNDPDRSANRARRPNPETELQRTYALFSGGRALSENLQLDRELQVTSNAEPDVSLASLSGITVKEIDWQAVVKDLTPQKDPLASVIPADQHVLFFPSFAAMTTLVDEAKANGTPILRLLDPRSEDALTHERYETQLCLSLDTWARLLGPSLIDSLAMTGSDPYLRTGSDVAVLFETSNLASLKAGIQTQYQRVQSLDHQVQSVSGTVLGHAYQGVVKTDRSVCSYLVTWDRTVLVTNSLVQLEKVLMAKTGQSETLNSLDEYTFFRDRYKRDEPETALLIVTDATIRRWCGPQWRIGTSRRVRAAAFMAQLQAKHMETLVSGLSEDQRHLDVDAPLAMGRVALTPEGVTSSLYGTLAFGTPISELALTHATQAEATAYKRYRDRYQQRWQQFFDPIAIRFHVESDKENRLSMDLTVRPLIASTQYQQFIDVTGNRGIKQGAGDPHEEALGQYILSIDRNASQIQMMGTMAAAMAPGLRANPLAWLGDWLSLYVDEDLFWREYQDVAATGNDRQVNEFMQNNLARLPLALHVDVSNSLKLAGFLVAARAFIEQTAPGMTAWDNQTYKNQAYVRIRPAESVRSQSNAVRDLAVYYAVTPKALVVSLSEPMIQRAIDRQQEPGDHKSFSRSSWLGENMAVHVKGSGMAMAQALFDHSAEDVLRKRSWGNLIILNEWHQRFGSVPAVELHQRLWQTRLVCPAGGDYVWNKALNCMESTVFGCPASPKTPESLPNALTSLKDVNMGLTFEDDGLRARAEIKR